MTSRFLCSGRRWFLIGLTLKWLDTATRRRMITYNTCSLACFRSSVRGSCCLILRRFLSGDPALLEHSEAASEDYNDVVVVPEFLTAEEGESLLQEISRILRGKKYLYDHWDGVCNAIHAMFSA